MYIRPARLYVALTALVLICAADARGQTVAVTTPKQHFGFNIGDDYQLANSSITGTRLTKNQSG
jgi:hypothetical protein